MFAEECQNNLLPVLQQWFQLDDASDRTLSVALIFKHNEMKNSRLKMDGLFSL